MTASRGTRRDPITAGRTGRLTVDEADAAYETVLNRHPDLAGDELDRKARRVAAILRYASDGPAWTVAGGAARP